MNTIITCILIFALSIVAFSFINLKLSISLYISYLILVPYLEFPLGGITVSYNLVNTLLLISFLYDFKMRKKGKLSFKMIKPFLFLFLFLLLISVFTTDTPFDFQLNSLRLSFMKTCILAFIISNYSSIDPKLINYIKWSLTISFIIAGVYGVFLMGLGGTNPYTSFLALHFGANDVAGVYSAVVESRLSFSSAGKIQSTMVHPMAWTLHLCFMVGVVIVHFFRDKRFWFIVLFSLLVFNILISGVRTGLAAIMFGAMYYLISKRQVKVMLTGLIFALIAFIVINANKDLSNIFASFTDVSGKKTSLQGSSISLRMYQLQGALSEIKGRELVGKGYDWTTYYKSKHGDHPVLLAFESLFFVVLCNSGIIGIFIWLVFFLMLFKLQRKVLKSADSIILMDTLVIVYVAYAIGTGEYGYIQIFALYYTFLMCSLMEVKEIDTKSKTYIYG